MQETQVQSLGGEGSLEKEMAAPSSILALEIPWTEKPGGLQSMSHPRASSAKTRGFHTQLDEGPDV